MHWLDPDYLPETKGVVERFLINPQGEIDGFLLKNRQEVHFPPHLSSRISKLVAIGDQIKVRGVKPRDADLIAGVALDSKDGRVVDNGPPEDDKHTELKLDIKSAELTGIVRQAVHGPKGEVRGVVLESGDVIRFPKHEAAKLASLLKAGAKFAARGNMITSKYGALLDAKEVGSSAETLQKFGLKHGPKHGKHAH